MLRQHLAPAPMWHSDTRLQGSANIVQTSLIDQWSPNSQGLNPLDYLYIESCEHSEHYLAEGSFAGDPR